MKPSQFGNEKLKINWFFLRCDMKRLTFEGKKEERHRRQRHLAGNLTVEIILSFGKICSKDFERCE